MIIGGLAGTGFWLAGLPGDRLKSTFQTDLEGRYKSVPHLTKSVLQEWLIYILTKKNKVQKPANLKTEGLSGLYRGLVPTMMRAFPSNAIVIVAYENVRDLL